MSFANGTLAFNSSTCSGHSGIPVLYNTTGTRLCAIRSTNTDLLKSCCDGSDVHTYECSSYCSTKADLSDFTKCVNQHGGNTSHAGVSVEDIFCQDNIKSNITENVKSSAGFRNASTPRYSYLVLVLVLGFFFSGASAAIIPSLSTGIQRRAVSASSASCTIDMPKNFTALGKPIQTSPYYSCDQEDFCTYGEDVSMDMDRNNRTINGTSAAEPMYDMFFELLQNKTGRLFPAMSNLEMHYDYNVMAGKSFSLNFTPLLWCMNGTVSGCQGVLGDNNGTMAIEACGPVFVSDVDGTDGEKKDNAAIQGIIAPLVRD